MPTPAGSTPVAINVAFSVSVSTRDVEANRKIPSLPTTIAGTVSDKGSGRHIANTVIPRPASVGVGAAEPDVVQGAFCQVDVPASAIGHAEARRRRRARLHLHLADLHDFGRQRVAVLFGHRRPYLDLAPVALRPRAHEFVAGVQPGEHLRFGGVKVAFREDGFDEFLDRAAHVAPVVRRIVSTLPSDSTAGPWESAHSSLTSAAEIAMLARKTSAMRPQKVSA